MLFYHIPILNGGFKGLFASANITTATLCPTHKKPQREKKKKKISFCPVTVAGA